MVNPRDIAGERTHTHTHTQNAIGLNALQKSLRAELVDPRFKHSATDTHQTVPVVLSAAPSTLIRQLVYFETIAADIYHTVNLFPMKRKIPSIPISTRHSTAARPPLL